MSADEIITHDGKRCTKVRKDGLDATSIFQTTSTATDLGPQVTTSLTQDASPTSSNKDGKSQAFSTLYSISSTSTAYSIPAHADTNPETSTLSDALNHGSTFPSVTEASGLNLPTESENPRPSFHTTTIPDGSSNAGPSGSTSDGDGGERADSQNPAAIAGGTIGAFVFIAMIILVWICIRRRRRKQRLAEIPTNVSSNDQSAVAVAEKVDDVDTTSTQASQLPAINPNTGRAPDSSEARSLGAPLMQSERRPSSRYSEFTPVAENQPPSSPPPRTGIGIYAAGILEKFRRLFSSSDANTQEEYMQQPSQSSSARSSYNERADGPIPQRSLSVPSLHHPPKARDAPMPETLNPFADPNSTNGVQRSPGFCRSPLARNPFEDPAPPDEDFHFTSPKDTPNLSASQHQHNESFSSSVIVLPNGSGESVRSVSIDATASEISRWRRDRESRISTRSDPFDLERTASVRTNYERRTAVSNTARSSQHLVP